MFSLICVCVCLGGGVVCMLGFTIRHFKHCCELMSLLVVHPDFNPCLFYCTPLNCCHEDIRKN
jgi:hypothetical protein